MRNLILYGPLGAWSISAVVALALACANYSGPDPDQCKDLVEIAADLSVLIADLVTDDEAKVEATRHYAAIVELAAEVGCELIPPENQPAPE